jgi:hypothetical protein
LIAKNVRIRAWQEEEASGTALVDILGRQGRQKLRKEYLSALSASMPRRTTGIIKKRQTCGQRTYLIHSFFVFLEKKREFLLLAHFPQIIYFSSFFDIFSKSVTHFSHE